MRPWRSLREFKPLQVIIALTFNHAKKDPVPVGLKIGPEVQVCLFEVNYLPSKEEPWDAIAGLIN